MDYLESAFGSFDPQQDPFAAAKFALNGLLVDRRLGDLRELLIVDHDTGGVEGVPGWILERRDIGQPHEYYAAWPNWAHFRAYVDPEAYALAHPECFMDRPTFVGYVNAGLKAYLAVNPREIDAVASLRSAAN